jgi:hypothetical protein
MITKAVVKEIRRMLLEGRRSQRSIAQCLGVSRGTVNAIARGRRRDSQSEQDDDKGFTRPTGLPVRCPGCGGLTQMPCLLCYVRARRAAEKPSRTRFCRSPNPGTIVAASCG